MTNNDMLVNLIDQALLGMIEWEDEDLRSLSTLINEKSGDRHAEYQGDWSRWVELTPEQKKQAYDNMWTE